MPLSTFLKASKQAALNAVKTRGSLEGWTIAVGNEAGGTLVGNPIVVTKLTRTDLDSLACAVAYAYYLHTRSNVHSVVPLLQTDKRDLHLRPENELALKHAKIDRDDLLCFDELGRRAAQFAQAKLAIVDHNKALSVFGDAQVTAVIDHHADEHAHLDAEPRLIEATGSCASLVALYFSQQQLAAASLPAELADLLLSAILIDTNLKEAPAGKATHTDMQAVEYLLGAGALSASSVATPMSQAQEDLRDRASELRKTKADVGHLPIDDLLRRDYKEYTVNGVHYGLATIPLSLSRLLAKNENGATGWPLIQSAMEAYEKEHRLEMLAILTSYVRTTAKGNTKPARELLFHFVDPAKLKAVPAALEASEVLQVEPWNPHDTSAPAFDSATEHWYLVNQGNTRATRKQVAPTVREAIEKLGSHQA